MCYVHKINDRCLAEFYSDNKIQSLCRILYFILKIVRYTFECYRFEYYDIVIVTKYSEGIKETGVYCTSIICLLWNVLSLIIKNTSTLFTIIVYYIFLGFFW